MCSHSHSHSVTSRNSTLVRIVCYTDIQCTHMFVFSTAVFLLNKTWCLSPFVLIVTDICLLINISWKELSVFEWQKHINRSSYFKIYTYIIIHPYNSIYYNIYSSLHHIFRCIYFVKHNQLLRVLQLKIKLGISIVNSSTCTLTNSYTYDFSLKMKYFDIWK